MPREIKTEKRIPFNTDMVKAILEGRKTQTRRIVKGNIHPSAQKIELRTWDNNQGYSDGCGSILDSPYNIGDTLWIRETYWEYEGKYHYAADYTYGTKQLSKGIRVHPSIHMPRAAARVFLKVTDVKAKKLWDISEEDATKEGCSPFKHSKTSASAKQDFMHLWQQIYDGDINKCWALNPWVWAIEFERTV